MRILAAIIGVWLIALAASISLLGYVPPCSAGKTGDGCTSRIVADKYEDLSERSAIRIAPATREDDMETATIMR